VLGAVAAAVVLLVGGLVLLTSGGEDDTTATAASADGEGEPAPETEDDAADDADGSDEDGDQATFDPDAGDDEPVETFEPTGTATTGARWVAILGSYPDAATAEGRRSQLAGTFPQHEFQVLQSADWATLNPGYHVPYHDGGFGSGEDAIAFCRSLGYSTRDQCYARFLSTDASAAQTQYPD
jgi:hypothetical protein